MPGLLTERAFIMEESSLTRMVDPARIDWRVREDVPMEVKEGSKEGE